MEKQKRWQFYLILAVIVLTLINILPTVFYYTKPLKDPVNQEMAEEVAIDITHRVNALEEDSKAWLLSFCKLLGIQPTSIELSKDNPGVFEISFKNHGDASSFQQYLPEAGSRIPFVPAQLQLYSTGKDAQNKILVSRQIDIHLDPADINKYFRFFPKSVGENVSSQFRESVYDRSAQIAYGLAGPSKNGTLIANIVNQTNDAQYRDSIIALAKEIVDVHSTFNNNQPLLQRYLASIAQVDTPNRSSLIEKFLAKMENLKAELEKEKKPLIEEQKKAKEKGQFLESTTEQRFAFLDNQHQALTQAAALLRKNLPKIKEASSPFTAQEIQKKLIASEALIDPKEPLQILNLEGRNPFIESLVIDWGNDKIFLKFYEDVDATRFDERKSEEATFVREKLNFYLFNEIARVSRISDESILPSGNEFAVNLTELTNPESFLTFDLGYVAQQQTTQILKNLTSDWNPQYTDLKREVYPILDYKLFQTLSPQEQKLGIVLYAPAMFDEEPPAGFQRTSIYVIARGLNTIIQKYRETPTAEGAKELEWDVNQLNELLKKRGFIAYPGTSFGIAKEFNQDFIFELDDYYTTLLNATRENFYVKGSKRYATLDFTNVEQRIVTLNQIEDRMQEDLIKWRDEYNAAQVDIDTTRRYLIPPPTKNAFWENTKLSMAKYFRGDDRKILKWGLDLSGGKTVRIGLRDQNNRVVTDPEQLNQAVNELYTRINKMGVAERTIRIENNNIILDFPGSQALSASELVKASAMYFHIVNEKFSMMNPTLREPVNQFLQNVWNEAVVTNRKDIQSINEIAWEHLGGTQNGDFNKPRTEAAQILFDNGLRLANPRQATKSSAFDDTLSSIAKMRGDDIAEWEKQPHPLMIVFHNYALEGSSLTNVQTGYDPSEGNTLHFEVKGSYDKSQMKGSGSPRDDFYAWTSQFSEDKIAGTPKEAYSQGRGWRMAIILNDVVVNSPSLKASLRDRASITGRFTQREITQLAADLKAGSLSFTPKILSEQNVSAELGKEERIHGITAAIIGLFLVAFAMIFYYRFAGLVATCAVFFNLLITWGVLQNMGAALTLPGIAGIVLTIGMAVDANVLVFERIREEFKISGRIASAIQTGYRKAFSAIIDSNVTTIIAALILIQFDSGPIKGFAVTLIIGLVSSMFTSLFMTRYFFAGWVQNPKNKELSMMELLGNTKFDFLKHTKMAVILSVIIMVIGGYFFVNQRNTLFGMDFTGGYSLTVELEEKPGDEHQYRTDAINAFFAKDVSSTNFEIRELTRPNQLRIQLGLGMEEEGQPFYQMPERLNEEEFAYEYEKDPRITWVVNALASGGLQVQQTDLINLDKNWSMMSGQFSEKMRDNAIIALSIALFSILVYITFRFEFKFAISAVIALAHDVIITMGILAVLKKIGLPVQIDLEVVGAIMTIIGYSLNDTIIVFDRIREDIRILRKLKFDEIINHALNVTLSRTIMTSGTTLLVLISLVTLGGHSIFDFSLVMTIGVLVGTTSSLFIAAPVLLYFHNRELRDQEKQMSYHKA